MKRTELILIAILSAWIAMTLFMWFAATQSFRTVDRVLDGSTAQIERAIEPLRHDQSRMVLRHLASEINRTFFAAYGWMQIVFGLTLVLLLFTTTPPDSTGLVLAGAMLALAMVLTFMIQPQIVSLGRSIDFLPRNPPPPQMSHFWMLHGSFTGLDGLKLLGAIGLLARCIAKR